MAATGRRNRGHGRSHKLLAHKGCPDLHQSTSATNAAPPRPHHQEQRSMFAYYLNLALRSFRRNKALTVLMVLAIALGIGASMTTLTVFHVLSGDPVPTRSGALFRSEEHTSELQSLMRLSFAVFCLKTQ